MRHSARGRTSSAGRTSEQAKRGQADAEEQRAEHAESEHDRAGRCTAAGQRADLGRRAGVADAEREHALDAVPVDRQGVPLDPVPAVGQRRLQGDHERGLVVGPREGPAGDGVALVVRDLDLRELRLDRLGELQQQLVGRGRRDAADGRLGPQEDGVGGGGRHRHQQCHERHGDGESAPGHKNIVRWSRRGKATNCGGNVTVRDSCDASRQVRDGATTPTRCTVSRP